MCLGTKERERSLLLLGGMEEEEDERLNSKVMQSSRYTHTRVQYRKEKGMDKEEKRADGGYRTWRLCNMKVFLIYQESHFGKRTWGGQSNPATTPRIYIYNTGRQYIGGGGGNDSVCLCVCVWVAGTSYIAI